MQKSTGHGHSRAEGRLLDEGVHAIGKKVVEEAAEAWMAAEHEGRERTAEDLAGSAGQTAESSAPDETTGAATGDLTVAPTEPAGAVRAVEPVEPVDGATHQALGATEAAPEALATSTATAPVAAAAAGVGTCWPPDL